MDIAKVSVLIPTSDRLVPLAATLTSLCEQTYKDFDCIISDQSENVNPFENSTIKCLENLLIHRGHRVLGFRHFPKLGVAEQRQFLLDKSRSKYSLFLDDDLILEPYVITNMVKALDEENCGFVGMAPIGLSYKYDFRPDQQRIEFFKNGVKPETVSPQDPSWERHVLHNAANILHVEKLLKLNHKNQKKYKVAWVGGCVMYDTEKLRECGGFSFWRDLDKKVAGEDVLAELRVMKKYGGCGLIPSGVYHQEVPTTVKDRSVNAVNKLNVI